MNPSPFRPGCLQTYLFTEYLGCILVIEKSPSNISIREWISNYIHVKKKDGITHVCGLTKVLLRGTDE